MARAAAARDGRHVWRGGAPAREGFTANGRRPEHAALDLGQSPKNGARLTRRPSCTSSKQSCTSQHPQLSTFVTVSLPPTPATAVDTHVRMHHAHAPCPAKSGCCLGTQDSLTTRAKSRSMSRSRTLDTMRCQRGSGVGVVLHHVHDAHIHHAGTPSIQFVWRVLCRAFERVFI